MVSYLCNKCNKTFTHKSAFIRHTERKISCDIEGYKCENCGKTYKHRQSLFTHNKHCSVPTETTINNDNRTINNQMNVDNSTNIDTLNQNMNVDGDVKLVKFGDENLSYISDDLFKSILGRGFKCVEELIDHSHFNPDHPENHNIYIANIKNDYVVIYDGKKWTVNRKEDVMEDIIYAKSDFLCMKFKELMSQMTETDIKKFRNFINQRDEDKTMNKIKRELKLQLYNNRHMPEKLRKQMEETERLLLKDMSKKKVKKIKQANNSSIDNIMNLLDGMNEDKVKDVEALLNRIAS